MTNLPVDSMEGLGYRTKSIHWQQNLRYLTKMGSGLLRYDSISKSSRWLDYDINKLETALESDVVMLFCLVLINRLWPSHAQLCYLLLRFERGTNHIKLILPLSLSFYLSHSLSSLQLNKNVFPINLTRQWVHWYRADVPKRHPAPSSKGH
jgi:hypothetical protein